MDFLKGVSLFIGVMIIAFTMVLGSSKTAERKILFLAVASACLLFFAFS